MSGTARLEELIKKLLDPGNPAAARALREQFYRDPLGVMEDYRLTVNERALLFTMDRYKIMAKTSGEVQQLIDAYAMESSWPSQGPDWDAPETGWVPVLPHNPAWAGEGFGGIGSSSGSDTRGGWSDPRPHGRGFRPESISRSDQPKQLTLVGEGFLGTARITLQNGNFLREVCVKEIHFANFRRTYVRTEPFAVDESWPPGEYEVKVSNHPDVDPLIMGNLLTVS